VRKGEDPAGERASQRAAPRINELLDHYIADHVPGLKPSTQVSELHLIKKHIRPRFGSRAILALVRKDIEALKVSMRKTPGAFNKVRDCISRIYNFAERVGGYGVTPSTIPTVGVRRNKARVVERFLRPHERAALMRELDAAPTRRPTERGYVSQAATDAFKLLALTGCRLGEILDLTWRSVDWDRQRLVFADSKTGQKSVYLSAQAMDLLAEISDRRESSGRVCPNETGGRLSNMQRRWRGIRDRAGIEDVRIHDLRHSLASDAVGAGLSLHLVGKLLGHRSSQSTARYAHLSDEAQAEAAERVGDAIAEAQRAGERVVPLVGRKGR
jgi:integrase